MDQSPRALALILDDLTVWGISLPDEWPSELNQASRRKFIDFSRLASMHPDVMEIVNVLHTAAVE